MSDAKAIFKFDRSQLVIIGVAVAMLVCFIAVICVPDARKMGSITKRLEEAESQWELQKAEVETLPEVSKRVADLREHSAALTVKVPADPMLPQFLGTVADLLTKGGARQHEIVPQAARVTEKYVALPIEVKFEATFEAAFGILARLESLDRVSTVESLKLNKTPGDDEGVAVEMRVVVYHTPSSAKSPAAQVASNGQGAVR